MAESDGRHKCILVDELVGKQEIVIKSLGEQLKTVKGMAGGAILADARVGCSLRPDGCPKKFIIAAKRGCAKVSNWNKEVYTITTQSATVNMKAPLVAI